MTPADRLAAGIAALERTNPAFAPLPGDAPAKLAAYLALLAKWNRTYNLTAVREPERMVTHHLLDALAVLPHLAGSPGMRLLDVGSGAGIPGLPLAIARPSWQVVLLDSSQKRGSFVRQVIAELQLANVAAVTERIEAHVPPQRYDVVIARAYADLATFARGALAVLAPGGQVVAMKGQRPDDEIAALPGGVRVVAVRVLTVPGLDAARHLVVLERDADAGSRRVETSEDKP